MSSSSPPPPNTQDRGLGLLAEEITLTTLALLTTIVRVGIRLFNRQARWDDLAISIAMLLRLLSFCFTMVTIGYGNGRHEYYLSDHQIQEILKYTWANEILIFATTCIVKISIILHIFRIKRSGWLKWLLYGTIVGLVVTDLACIIILFAQCSPLRAFWDHSAGSCWSPNIYNDFIYVSVGYSIASDLLCTAMPIVILWNVRITKKQKWAICGLMFLGLIASMCAAVRAYLSSLAEGSDLTYELVRTDEWAFAEANVGIIAANLALGQVVFVFVRKHWRKSHPAEKKPARLHGYSWKPRLHKHNRSESTLCDQDTAETKNSELERSQTANGDVEDSTGPRATTTDSNTTTATTSTHDSSRSSWWTGFRYSNPANTITRTIEFTVAGVPYNESQDQGRPPLGAPLPWDHSHGRVSV